MQYFVTPAHCIAINGKVCTTSIAYAIVRSFYPDRLDPAVEMHELAFRALVEQTDAPDKPVLLLVREPVDRFLSACGMLGMPIDEALESNDIHLSPQAAFLPATSFRFPDQIDEFCKEAGFAVPLPVTNEGGKKPKPTAQQLKAIRRRYAADVALYESL